MAPQKRLYILLSVCLALFLSLAIYYGMIFFLVNPYIENTDKLPNIFNLYTEKTGDSASKVYILGSSQVREDVNASVIRELWQEKNVSADVFNLGYTGDTPLRRLTELQAMKKSHPDLVIVGVSYQSFSENGEYPLRTTPDSGR